MIPKIDGSQRDFSSGEIDVTLKRADEHPVRKAGLRQCQNFRLLNSGAVQNRSGRTALFLENGRVEKVLMLPASKFFLAFGNTYLRVYNSAGSKVFDTGNVMPWTTATLGSIVWDINLFSIYICFPGNVPQVLTWSGMSTWSIANYAELHIQNPGASDQKRTMFYRLSPPGVTMAVSATTGVVTLTFSAGMNLVAGHVNTRMRYVNRQLAITAVTNSTTATAQVQEALPAGVRLTFGVSPQGQFQAGDVIIGSVSGAKGIVVGFAGGGNTMDAQQTTLNGFTSSDTIVGPNGSLGGVTGAALPPQAIVQWDDEVMNSFRGWPSSCFVDQNRLGFCNFPNLPSFIAWSAIGAFGDLYTDANNAGPANAIQEFVPGKSQVLYVMPGTESSEFVFCNDSVYYVPISVNNPLKPGSVAFNTLSTEGVAPVQPRRAEQVIIYVSAGSTKIKAVLAPGAYNRPYVVDSISEFHSHLIKSLVAIAVSTASSQFEESYLYALNNDGTLIVGKYQIKSGLISGNVGWVPWSGAGTVEWIAARGGDVIFTTSYAPNGIAPVSIIEILDDTQYLDCAIPVQNVPTPFVTGGKGPLFAFANGTVTLMDQGTRFMGTYNVDANGNIVPQNNGGENLSIASLVAGQPWTSTLEPFCPDANPGNDVHQRMFPRRVARFAAYVVSSTGFTLGRLFSGRITPTSPALGTLMNSRRFPAWNQDDDPTKPPPLRETTERIRPLGRSFDPRVALIKDTPGPLQVLELGVECTI